MTVAHVLTHALPNLTHEIYRFHLLLYEMTKSEKVMLILGKLHAISKSSDSIQHARQLKPRKRRRVTCGYCFDDGLVCKDGFLFLHELGTKQKSPEAFEG